MWKKWFNRKQEAISQEVARKDDERGASATEYIIILGLIIGVAFVAVRTFGNDMDAYYKKTSTDLFPK